MDQKVDLRVIKTRNNIQDAFVRLLQDKKFESITVQNILDKALINRSTFYQHYQSKYDLADHMIAELLDAVKKDIDGRFTAETGNLASSLKPFYRALCQKKDKILALLEVRTLNHYLSEDIRKILKAKYRKHRFGEASQLTEQEMSYQSEIYASIVITSIKWLLETGDEAAIEVVINGSANQMSSTIREFTRRS